MILDPGSRLGTYEILGPLGAGGMGEVYRARDRKLGREVAIKILTEAFASDPGRVARFEREARMLAAVNHPSIAAIYGAEEDGDFRYIVMELVPGETLSEKLAAGPIALPEALGFAVQIAEALAVAHERGVIHRDLKPANIKITPEGRVKVLDLGLAKATAIESAPEPNVSNSPTLALDESRPGNILGTPGFMSPEQVRGKEADRRVDIWAFGCVLFEMLTGRCAFTGDSVPEVLAAILSQEPDWKALPAGTPQRIRELLARCLEKDPNRRLRDAGDLRIEIESARAGEGVALAGAPRWKVVAAALVGAAAVAIGMFALRSRDGPGRLLPDRKFVAVLSVGDTTGEPTAQRMGDGFAETVRERLSHASTLQVVPTPAVHERPEREKDLRRMAHEIGANLVVRISFWIEGDQVRAIYRVVNVDEGAPVRSGHVDGPLSRVFVLADDLANSVAKDLEVPPLPPRSPTPTGLETPSEWKRYLEALGLLRRYDRRDAIEQAAAILTALGAERPNSPLVQAALGRADLALFEHTKETSWADRALAAAAAARRLDPDRAEVNLTVGATLLATGRATEAVEAYRRVLATNPDDFEALLGLGPACEKAGDGAAAESAFRRAIELQPSSFAGHNHLGGFLYDRGRYGDAAAAFRRAAKLAPDSYRAFYNLGGASTMACDFSGAADAYRKALAVQPDNPNAASNLGLNQLWTGHATEAVASLERAKQHGAKDYRIWANVGDAYRAAGRTETAAEAYGRALALARERLRLNPRETQAYQIAAVSLAKTGRLVEAEEPMRQALALEPNDPDVLANAATVAALAGRSAEALEWLRKAVAAGYCRAIILRQPEFARLADEPAFRLIVAAPREAAGS